MIISDTDHLFGLGGDRFWVWKTFTRGLNPIFMDGYDYGWVYPDSGNTQDATWEDVRRNLGYTADYAARVDLATMGRGTSCPRRDTVLRERLVTGRRISRTARMALP